MYVFAYSSNKIWKLKLKKIYRKQKKTTKEKQRVDLVCKRHYQENEKISPRLGENIWQKISVKELLSKIKKLFIRKQRTWS